MSMYMTIAPGLERSTAENSSATPMAPQALVALRPGRVRVGAAALLRWVAHHEVAAADRLERPAYTVAA